MEIKLTPDQEAFARRAVEAGRLREPEAAVEEALALWEERERGRMEFLATLDDARASLARGEGRVITQESMRELAAEVKKRGRARLIADLAHTDSWRIELHHAPSQILKISGCLLRRIARASKLRRA